MLDFEDEYRICSSGCDFNQTSSTRLCQLYMELEFYSRNRLNVDVIRVVLVVVVVIEDGKIKEE